MSTEKVVFNKLFKDKKEVNLSKVKDLEGYSNDIDTLVNGTLLELQKLAQDIAGYEFPIENARSLIKEAQGLGDEIITSFNDLGVEVPQDVRVYLNRIEANRSYADEILQRIERTADAFLNL
jgi:hypothetical protein